MDPIEYLYDYTKFHIGLYFTVSGGILVALSTDAIRTSLNRYEKCIIFIALVALVVAGMAASLVASSIPRWTIDRNDTLPFDKLGQQVIGPWFVDTLTNARLAIAVEHTAFWIAVLLLLLTTLQVLFLPCGSKPPSTEPTNEDSSSVVPLETVDPS